MIKNYFKTAFRSLLKNKVFSLINISGLAIGISSSLVIFLIVSYDLSFDKFEKTGDRIYRVVSDFVFSGETYHNSGVTYPMGKALQTEVTGIENTIHLYTWGEAGKVSIPGNSKEPVIFKKQEHTVFADEHYFKMIPYQWLAGSAGSSLQYPYQIVLTLSKANQYFPKFKPADIIGKEVIFNDTIHTKVSGIVKDIEENTDFNFTTFVSKATHETHLMDPGEITEWGSTTSSSQILVQLSPGTNPAQVQKQVIAIYNKYRKRDADDHSKTSYSLQPLADMHFNINYGAFDGNRRAHMPTLYGLLAVAVFLLLLGCINFINLTTAQSTQRAKEIGIRKTMGGSRRQLIFQFLSETFLLTFVATLLSIAITPLLLKVFADFIPEGLHFHLQADIIVFLILLIVVVCILSGLYPALILSSYKPVLVLKNQVSSGKARNAWMRKTLTVSQFVIAQVFIIGTILVSKQISYTLNKDLGFKKDAIIYFHTNYYDTSVSHRFVLMNKLKAIPEISMVSLSSDPPSINSVWTSTMKYKDGKKELEADVQVKLADTNYFRLYQMKLLAGNNIPYTDTTTTVVINESYANFMGFKDPSTAIGKFIEWNSRHIPISGVVANFHQRSLHEPIKPLLFTSRLKQERGFNIALQPQNADGTLWKTAIAKMGKAFKEVYPEDDFDYHFMDDTIKKYYTAEQNISQLLMWATALAIFISCLGLLGLITYITNQRTKEIGVRKVVGATVPQIIALISKDFMKLVLIAFIIAVPITYWGAYKWLQGFAFRTNISAWVFLAGGLIMFVMAMAVLCLRIFKAATVNPVKSLRTE